MNETQDLDGRRYWTRPPNPPGRKQQRVLGRRVDYYYYYLPTARRRRRDGFGPAGKLHANGDEERTGGNEVLSNFIWTFPRTFESSGTWLCGGVADTRETCCGERDGNIRGWSRRKKMKEKKKEKEENNLATVNSTWTNVKKWLKRFFSYISSSLITATARWRGLAFYRERIAYGENIIIRTTPVVPERPSLPWASTRWNRDESEYF